MVIKVEARRAGTRFAPSTRNSHLVGGGSLSQITYANVKATAAPATTAAAHNQLQQEKAGATIIIIISSRPKLDEAAALQSLSKAI
jgi:hypothetical protein